MNSIEEWDERVRSRWDLIRRNPEYREGYAKLQGMQPSDPRFQILVEEMCDLFQIQSLINPVRGFAQLSQAEKMWLNPSSTAIKCFHPLEVFLNPGRTLLDKPGIGIENIIDDKSKNFMFLRIDFSKIRSTKSLKTSIGHLIESRYKMYQEFDQVPKRKDVRKREFERILQIGDMHLAGMTIEKIAAEVFPDDHSQDSAKQKVRNDLDRYKELVNDRFKHFIA